LITSIASKDAGKTVQVLFARPLADWQTLFSPLLPSHILKDSPGGWSEGLATGIPVSGNRYKMQGYDSVTGEITLVRNDKYWGKQPGPSVAVLRIGTAAALTQALGRGDLQAVLLQPDAVDQRKLEELVPASNRVMVPLPGTVQLIFNTVQGTTSDLRVRRAIAAGLDVSALRAVLDGGSTDGGAAVTSLVSLPPAAIGKSQSPAATTSNTSPTVSATQPPGGSAPAPGSVIQPDASRTAAATAELEAAGYRRESLYMHKDGHILRLTLAFPAEDSRLAAAARLAQAQLAAAGIEVDLVRDQARAVVNNRVALGTVDLAMVAVPRGPSDGISVASAFGCPLPVPATQPAGKQPAPRAGNLAGFCSSNVQTLMDQAEDGSVPGNLDGLLQEAIPVIQISRPSAIFATTPVAAPVLRDSGPGWSYSGPLAGLARWPYG
jgi:ABC-type transport system substrate-binding protein